MPSLSPAVTLSVTILPKVTVLVGTCTAPTVGAVPNAPITRTAAERRDTVVAGVSSMAGIKVSVATA